MKPTPEFIRELSSNYMVLCPLPGEEDSFALKMLVRNKIDGLIPMEVKTINNRKNYYYDITGREPVSELLQKRQVSFLQLRELYEQILKLPDILKEFLLPENSILMEPEFVYTDMEMKHIEFCCYLGINKTLQEQIGEFTEYLLNKVDYKDEKAVLAVYALYQVSHDKNCTLEKLRDVFEMQCRKIKDTGENFFRQEVEEKKEIIVEDRRSDDRGRNVSAEEKNTKEKREQDMDIRIKKVFPESVEKQDVKQEHTKKETPDFSYMEERMESQAEVLRYPPAVYGKAAIVLAAGFFVLFVLFQTGVFNVDGKPDITRYFFAVSGCLLMEGISFFFIFQKKNQCAEVKEIVDYLDWEDAYDLQENSGMIYEDAAKGYYQDAFLKETGKSMCGYSQGIQQDEQEEKTLEEDNEDEETPTEFLVDFQDNSIAYLESEFSGERIYLKKFPFLIGKLKKGTDYVLNNNKISRIHARIDYDESRYYIEDMDSTNGTSLNGTGLAAHERQVLSDKDRICFADKNFIFHC